MNTPTVLHGDALVHIRSLSDNSIDAVITDPPYNLAFMGKAWDDHKTGRAFQDWCEVWLRECLRVLKPGGHLLAFGGTRTWHRLASAAEDAGFEIRDSMAWLYGQGFPKSLDVSKAVESTILNGSSNTRALQKTEQDGGGESYSLTGRSGGILGETRVYDRRTFTPATPEAQQWQGWGTALKPAFEPIVVARKPLTGTVAANVLEHGTGALNVDGCRIGSTVETWPGSRSFTSGISGGYTERVGRGTTQTTGAAPPGRWPANVILDEHTAAIVDEQSGVSTSGAAGLKGSSGFADGYSGEYSVPYGDTGGASRFFYNAKASKSERPVVNGIAHPTVKPIALMRWLVRLVAPPGGVVLDPFAGSGTTAEACILEGFDCIVIEREDDYLPLIDERINRNNPTLFTGGDVLV